MPKSPHDFHNFSLQNTKKSQTKDLSIQDGISEGLQDQWFELLRSFWQGQALR